MTDDETQSGDEDYGISHMHTTTFNNEILVWTKDNQKIKMEIRLSLSGILNENVAD